MNNAHKNISLIEVGLGLTLAWTGIAVLALAYSLTESLRNPLPPKY